MTPSHARSRRTLLALAVVAASLVAPAGARAQGASTTDPRVGLKGGLNDAGEAKRNIELVGHGAKAPAFAASSGFAFLNSDLAFSGHYVVQGNFAGFQVWDVSDVRNPRLRTTFVCPGGQGDPSIYRNLLFISVEETRGRVDCGDQGITDTVSAERFRGVRIFDITDIEHPKQVAAVQSCRGSHTHTLVEDPRDKANIYVYISGTAGVRSPNELAGCSRQPPDSNPNPSRYRIDIVRVPLAAPQDAKLVGGPRIFSDSTGAVAGLWKGGSHGEGTQATSETDQCHDITVYTAIGLAAGACSGNGILLDIRDPANPRRVDAAMDPNFAYWHSATFSNDGSKVVFTDEWGGGAAPRCRATDKLTWGADALFTVKDNKLTAAGYFKIPAAQSDVENCVAHNGGLIPVPGRDIMVQGWYQGGLSVFDFTDAAHPVEIAYFDRGPIDAKLVLAGMWGGYWYNGHIYASEIGRGLDILQLTPSDLLSQNEIDAANLVKFEQLNPQNQPKVTWPAAFPVARAYLDQLVRGKGIAAARATAIAADLAGAEKLAGAQRKAALNTLASRLSQDARTAADSRKVAALAAVVKDMAK